MASMRMQMKQFMCFKQGTVLILSGKPLKFIDQFLYFDSNISSAENGIDICLSKTWTDINRITVIWKSDLFDKIKQDFFLGMSVLLYRCTTWTLTRCMKNKLDVPVRILSMVQIGLFSHYLYLIGILDNI